MFIQAEPQVEHLLGGHRDGNPVVEHSRPRHLRVDDLKGQRSNQVIMSQLLSRSLEVTATLVMFLSATFDMM